MRKLSLMDKKADDAPDAPAAPPDEPPGHGPQKTRAWLVISIDAETQDAKIRRKRKSLALRLKERILRRVEPEPVTEGWTRDSEDSDDEERQRRRGCFGC